MTQKNKLYRVTLQGSIKNFSPSYVVALDSESAYRRVREWLDSNDYAFSSARELKSVELIAEDYQYTDTGSVLFV